ncbi:pyridoxal phosphate-dependent aminotransferase [[Kitasatospora] papulosa]|uniref:pyridoxal phosphate-dependent aminotransferase n=1 Tax=[Kitasatospora] papulosa TaxID=1464011 RepID=UPI00367C03D9
MEPARTVLDSGRLPNDHEDARLIHLYEAEGGDIGNLVYLSLGETWNSVAPGLAAILARPLPAHTHGYTLSPYGLPALRDEMRSYIVRTHDLRAVNTDSYDVSVSQSGTRAAMSDFGRLLLSSTQRPALPPTAVIPSPGWDYKGVLKPLGYQTLSYHLRFSEGWQPDVTEIESLLRRASPNALLVLNAQHNPTGTNWEAERVRRMIELAILYRAAVLLDDAYYSLHAPGSASTNSLRILLQQTQRSQIPWLATRTLGKQFHCNGWGIGALTAHPKTLTHMARVAQERSYGSALPLQSAMATWLRKPESDAFVDQLRHHYAAARQHVAERLHHSLGFPAHTVHPGTCTSYLRFRVPTRFIRNGSEAHYRRLCLAAGVLPGAGSMTAESKKPYKKSHGEAEAYVRLFLGQPTPLLNKALDRLAAAGLGW